MPSISPNPPLKWEVWDTTTYDLEALLNRLDRDGWHIFSVLITSDAVSTLVVAHRPRNEEEASG